MIVSDCGSQFVSSAFKTFCEKWCITHVTSSPGHQRENGKAKSAVKIAKTLLKKTAYSHQDQYLAFLELRNTPRQDASISPTEIMLGRQTRSVIPSARKKEKNWNFQATQQRQQRRDAVKRSYDKTAKTLSTLHTGQSVIFQFPDKREWRKGIINKQLGSRTYIIRANGAEYKRNRVHIRPDTSSIACPIDDHYEPSIPFLPPDSEQVQNNTPQMPVMNARPQRLRRPPSRYQDYDTH